MRKVRVQTQGVEYRTVARVVSLESLSAQWRPELRFLVRAVDARAVTKIAQLRSAGLANLILLITNRDAAVQWQAETVLETNDTLIDGDVVAVADHMNHAHVLFRYADQHHTVFLTNRCNSYCLMCSQPPTKHDDSWLADEAVQVANHMACSPHTLGFSGGEPLLLGERLSWVLNTFAQRHPSTRYDVLSNGRLLADPSDAKHLLHGLGGHITWMVPLYGHADFLHDFVVQSPGAFEETLAGLLNLHRFGQAIQLRIVLIRPVLENLAGLCEFIGRNLPFVREVALMACEPIGFALANPELTDIDLRDWSAELRDGFTTLKRAKVPAILMNAPLCALPQTLWPYAHKSISDWKRTFADDCATCTVKTECAGLFSWHRQGKHAMKIQKIEGIINV
ncbi:His-Xaa-Ser system radical SAM maturase HxsC [Pseudomonas congelans]|uniref:His-Xaa-Ser system radical SAM maturase HxsC n=1 Tax=Pseudomonas congelans TaxID=200452 RepID=UPI001BDD5A30|nr:His-Xaa-Ser system radical SAM maturase HxsC [Pseudomonas congelans]QVX17090.1 His-Xaa-Ser system radical SAM maturase HxsC [Pseudomonas congelans]